MLLAAVLALVSSGAMAQVRCGNRDNIIEWLAAKYKETPVATGVANTGGLVEVLSTGEGKTWTIIVTMPQGKSCIVAAGEGWRIKQRATDDAEPQA
jgi:hypothetical protein